MSERFKVEDDEVFDHALNIVWRKKAERDQSGKLLKLNWRDALAHAWQETQKEKNPEEKMWRLPTVEELSSLIEINQDGKPMYPKDNWIEAEEKIKNTWFRTSSPVAGAENRAWIVYFLNGYVLRSDHGFTGCVRLVRGSSRSVLGF